MLITLGVTKKGSLFFFSPFAAKTAAKDVFSGDKGEEGIVFFLAKNVTQFKCFLLVHI